MRKIIAFIAFLLGLSPLSTVYAASFTTPQDQDFEASCREELGASASQEYFMNRCVNKKRGEIRSAEKFQEILQRKDQKFWKNQEAGDAYIKKTQRTSREALRKQMIKRTSFFKGVPMDKRAQILKTLQSERRKKLETAESGN